MMKKEFILADTADVFLIDKETGKEVFKGTASLLTVQELANHILSNNPEPFDLKMEEE